MDKKKRNMEITKKCRRKLKSDEQHTERENDKCKRKIKEFESNSKKNRKASKHINK